MQKKYPQFNKKDLNDIVTAAGNKKVDDMIEIIHRNDPTDRSLAVRYSIARKILKVYSKDEELLNKLIPPEKITKEIQKESVQRRDSKKMIKVTKNFIDKILLLSKSNDLYEMAIYLLFITGRRTGELYNAKFYSKRGKPDIYIDGVLKRSDDGNGCHFPPLVNKTKTLKIMKRFKAALGDKSYLTEPTFRRELLRRLKKYLGNIVYPHMLRGIYVNYLHKFRNDNDAKINTFIMEKLCHETVSTSLNYTGYEILFDEDYVK